jgi:NAD(P)-dependent dehydrogenase (short-subunit alcohol dehydrogenase family)
VRHLADNVYNKVDQLDVLINNAGVYMNMFQLSKDGYEMTFAVNHLAHFALTLRLKELFLKSGNARIVNVSSIAHTRSDKPHITSFTKKAEFSPYGSYALSKLCNILFSNELAARWQSKGIISNSLHPGVITTKLLQAGFNITGDSLESGARTSVFLASAESVAGVSGKYFIDSVIRPPSVLAENKALGMMIWKFSEEATGLSD